MRALAKIKKQHKTWQATDLLEVADHGLAVTRPHLRQNPALDRNGSRRAIR